MKIVPCLAPAQTVVFSFENLGRQNGAPWEPTAETGAMASAAGQNDPPLALAPRFQIQA